MMSSDEDDVPTLSAHALAALQEFQAERMHTSDTTEDPSSKPPLIEEDWVNWIQYCALLYTYI